MELIFYECWQALTTRRIVQLNNFYFINFKYLNKYNINISHYIINLCLTCLSRLSSLDIRRGRHPVLTNRHCLVVILYAIQTLYEGCKSSVKLPNGPQLLLKTVLMESVCLAITKLRPFILWLPVDKIIFVRYTIFLDCFNYSFWKKYIFFNDNDIDCKRLPLFWIFSFNVFVACYMVPLCI